MASKTALKEIDAIKRLVGAKIPKKTLSKDVIIKSTTTYGLDSTNRLARLIYEFEGYKNYGTLADATVLAKDRRGQSLEESECKGVKSQTDCKNIAGCTWVTPKGKAAHCRKDTRGFLVQKASTGTAKMTQQQRLALLKGKQAKAPVSKVTVPKVTVSKPKTPTPPKFKGLSVDAYKTADGKLLIIEPKPKNNQFVKYLSGLGFKESKFAYDKPKPYNVWIGKFDDMNKIKATGTTVVVYGEGQPQKNKQGYYLEVVYEEEEVEEEEEEEEEEEKGKSTLFEGLGVLMDEANDILYICNPDEDMMDTLKLADAKYDSKTKCWKVDGDTGAEIIDAYEIPPENIQSI